MSVEEALSTAPDPGKRLRTPLLVAAWTQGVNATLLLFLAGPQFLPPVDLYDLLLPVVMVLQFCSAVALLLRRPGSWWVALRLQPLLLAFGVGIALHGVYSYHIYDARADLHGLGPFVFGVTLLFALPLALSALTALLYLVRPRTRESFGLPPISPSHPSGLGSRD